MVDLIHSLEQSQLKRELPEIRPGDTVRVHNRIVEGDQERVQVFRGTVIRVRKEGSMPISPCVALLSTESAWNGLSCSTPRAWKR